MLESAFFNIIFSILILALICAVLFKVQIPKFKKIWLPSEDIETKISEKIGYKCEHCGAGLDEKADVSPSGDVKCTYCKKWFNILGQNE